MSRKLIIINSDRYEVIKRTEIVINTLESNKSN